MNKTKIKNIFAILILILAILKFYSVFFAFESFSKIIMLISLGLASLLILDSRKSYNILHMSIILISLAQFLIAKNITMFYTIYLCMAFIDIDFKMIAKVFIVANCILFAIYLLLNLVGIYPTQYLEGRNDFGFGNPNSAFICMFLIWSSFFYIINEKGKKLDYILLFLLIFVTYVQTETRTGLLAAIATIIFYFILKKVDISNKKIATLISIIPIIGALTSIILAVFVYDNYFINSILSSRPLYWNAYIMHPTFGLNLFGYAANIREYLFTTRTPMDSGYMWGLYSQGIMAFSALVIGISISMYSLCKKNKKSELLLLVSILVYCFAESILLDISTNIGLILMVQNLDILNYSNLSISRLKAKNRN